jgi:hypothetical protein
MGADRRWTFPAIVAAVFAATVGALLVWTLVELFTGGLGGM